MNQVPRIDLVWEETAAIRARHNKVDTEEQRQQAQRIAANVLCQVRIDRVIAGALEGANPNAWTLHCRTEF